MARTPDVEMIASYVTKAGMTYDRVEFSFHGVIMHHYRVNGAEFKDYRSVGVVFDSNDRHVFLVGSRRDQPHFHEEIRYTIREFGAFHIVRLPAILKSMLLHNPIEYIKD